MKNKMVYVKILVNFILAGLLVLFCICALPKLIWFFWPFIVGWVIAVIANPLVKFMEKKIKIVRKHSSAIIIILVLAIIVGLFYLCASIVLRECIDLLKNLPDIYRKTEIELNNAVLNMKSRFNVLPGGVQIFFDNAGNYTNEFVSKQLGSISNFTIKDASSIVKNLAEGFLMFIITVLSSYFFIADRDKIVLAFKKRVPLGMQKQYNLIMDNFVRAVGGYFKAQLKIMVLIFAILYIGMLIMGVNYAVLLAFLIAFIDFLPILGAGTAMLPWAVYELITGNYFRTVVIIVFYLICQVTRQVIQPKMLGDSIGLSPLATLIFMFVGYRIGGILGIIIGIPIGMIILNFYESGLFDNLIRGAKIMIEDFNKFRKF